MSTLATGTLCQLTFDDGLDRLDGWSRDGRWLYFSSWARDISGRNDTSRVSATGGTPMAVSAETEGYRSLKLGKVVGEPTSGLRQLGVNKSTQN